MTPVLSAITTCKGRLDHLKLTLPHLMALEGCEVVVVDYDCPDGAGDWVRATYPAATVVRVEDRPFFNLSHARNLGAAAATAPWLLLVDADVVVSPGLIGAVRGLLHPGAYLLPEPRPPQLCGTLLVARPDFEAIGGHDEAFEGWGAEDFDFTMRLDRMGLGVRTFPGELLDSVPHDDALRVRFHEVGDRNLNWLINGLYSAAKRDLINQGLHLDPAQAKDLYAGVRAALRRPGGPAPLNVTLPARKLLGLDLEVSLSYRLTRPETPSCG